MGPIQSRFPQFLTLPVILLHSFTDLHETPEGRKPKLTASRNQRGTPGHLTGLKLEFSLQHWFSRDFRTYGRCVFIWFLLRALLTATTKEGLVMSDFPEDPTETCFFFPVMKKHLLAAQVYAVLLNFVTVEGSENKNLLKGTQPSSRPGTISWTKYRVLSTGP